MPRHPRSIAPGQPYHLISRFVDREWFIETNFEREQYLQLLARSLAESDWRLLAYAIMSSHMHFWAIAGIQPLDLWIRRVHSPFADALNRSHDRIGSVFARGPKAEPVETEGEPHLLAYIHNNPVRAGIGDTAADNDWTSHRAYIGEAPVPPWLHVAEGLARGGFSDGRSFDHWVNAPERSETDFRFTEEYYAQQAAERRDALEQQRRCGAERLADQIASLAANATGVAVSTLRSRSRGCQEVLGRSVAIRAARGVGLSGVAIARALALTPARVSTLMKTPPSNVEQLLVQQISAALT